MAHKFEAGCQAAVCMDRIEEGRKFLEFLWFSIAEDVVATAVRVYQLDGEQAAALRLAFLRPGDYRIEVDA
jgi:hypothetical protein